MAFWPMSVMWVVFLMMGLVGMCIWWLVVELVSTSRLDIWMVCIGVGECSSFVSVVGTDAGTVVSLSRSVGSIG
jgi:hypothetical protein